MNEKIEIEATATVRWNALEATILSELLNESRHEFQESNYTLSDMIELNGKIGRALDPDDETYSVPDRFHTEDHTGKIPVKDLFDKTEELIANLDRARTLGETFRYDETARP